MTPAQRNLVDAAKHLLGVIAEPNEIAYELTIDNATNRLDDAIKAAEADDSLGLTDEEIDAGLKASHYQDWPKRQRDAFRAAVMKHRKERGGC